MIHTSPPPNIVNSRTLSRSPLQTIPTNPLQYNSSSTNTHTTQHSIQFLELVTQTVISNNFIQHHNVPVPPTSIKTNPYFTPISQIPTNTYNLQTNTSHSNYHITHPYAQPSTTISNPTYINSQLLIQNLSNHLMVLIMNIHLQNVHNTMKPVLHFPYVYYLRLLMNISSGEIGEWLLYNALTCTALSWYICLNDTYKQDWSAFVQDFKKQFSSQKNALYAQVEVLTLVKKTNETVLHFAPKGQQLVERGWCNENVSTINVKCNEIFIKGLPKTLEEFANKSKVKHTSTVLEPTKPFHTFVKLANAEDKANDKIRLHDLTLEVNSITNQLQ